MAEGLRSGYAPEGQKRWYVAHFVSKLTDADGLRLGAYASESEQAEVQHWLATAMACDYLAEKEQAVLLEKCARIGQMLGAMMADPDKWCRNANRDRKSKLSGQRKAEG